MKGIVMDKKIIINESAVYHRTTDQMCYAFNTDELIINIRTGKEVERVDLIWGDPYEAGIAGGAERWEGELLNIPFKKDLKNHTWWTTTVKPMYKRCKYYFKLQAGDTVRYLFEDGFWTEEQIELPGKMLQYFIMPWMNPTDINVTPDWVNDTVWYQIFPDRFNRGTGLRKTRKLTPWHDGPITNEEHCGGTLKGITEQLPYLKGLGITGIYLTPVCESPSNHKYDTTDYMKIDSGFGTEKDMVNLVSTAHSLGIRVMMDGVFNHCGMNFKPWQDVIKKGKRSKYADWFMVNRFPVETGRDTRDGRYYSFAFCDNMPKLNTNNDEVIAFIERVCTSWVDKFDIDGIRFDVGNEISHRLLKRLRRTLKSKKEDFYLLGELWHDSSQWLMGDEYDAVMNYPLTSGINDFFIDNSLNKQDFAYRINACYTMYQQQNNNVLFNLLDSHDTDRLMTRVNDPDIFIQELAALFTMPGSVCIYYGTEIGLEGDHDPDCRRCMPWHTVEDAIKNESKVSSARGSHVVISPDDENNTAYLTALRYHQIKELIRLRKQEKTFRSLYFHFPNEISEPRCVEYIKLDSEGNKIQILLNGSDNDIELSNEGEILFTHLYDGRILPPKGTLIRRLAD